MTANISRCSADLLARECSFIIDNAAEPTLFLESQLISYGESGHGENNNDRLLNKGNLATFILWIKDIGLTKSTTNMT
ncbi:unnamed protein product [Schistosoma bovis]|nr:unnamed protein product [Schistosoma bovis]